MIKTKSFHVKLEQNLHKFLKMYAIQHDTDMNSIIVEFVKKLKEKKEKLLTVIDACVQ